MILRQRDANSGWVNAADGTMEERRNYCQNWRNDTSALLTSAGVMVEWAKYSAYGVPIGLPGADTDSDGDCDATDITQIQTWIDAPAYDVRGDVDLDGDVDATDKSTAQNNYQGTTSGWRVLSAAAVANRAGCAGYQQDVNLDHYHVRNRVLEPHLGRWTRRDPLGYVDGMSLYEYVGSMPNVVADPTGFETEEVFGWSEWSRSVAWAKDKENALLGFHVRRDGRTGRTVRSWVDLPRAHTFNNQLRSGEIGPDGYENVKPRHPIRFLTPWDEFGGHRFATHWDYHVRRTTAGEADGWEKFTWEVSWWCDRSRMELDVFDIFLGPTDSQGDAEVEYAFSWQKMRPSEDPFGSMIIRFCVKAGYSEIIARGGRAGGGVSVKPYGIGGELGFYYTFNWNFNHQWRTTECVDIMISCKNIQR